MIEGSHRRLAPGTIVKWSDSQLDDAPQLLCRIKAMPGPNLFEVECEDAVYNENETEIDHYINNEDAFEQYIDS